MWAGVPTGVLLIVAAAVVWSTGGVGVKTLEGYGPLTVAGGRSAITALFFLLLMGGAVAVPRALWRAVGVGSLLYVGVVLGFVSSTKFTTAANAILLQCTAPLWIALIGWALWREKPTRLEWLLLIVGFGGTGLCALDGLLASSGAPPPTPGVPTIVGDAIAVASGVCFGALTILLARSGRAAMADPASTGPSAGMLTLFWGNALTAAIGSPALVAQIGLPGVPDAPVYAGWAVLLWLGFGQLGFGYWLFQRGLRTTPALQGSLIGLAEPVLNPLWVFLAVGEKPGLLTVVGGALVLAAVMAMVLAKARGEAPPPAQAASGGQ